MKRAESPRRAEDWIPEGGPEILKAPAGQRPKPPNRSGAAKPPPPKRQPRQPRANKAVGEGPSANTQEWLAVSKEKPSGSIRAADADGADGRRPPSQRGIGGAVNQRRRLSSGLRSVKRELADQQAQIDRLEEEQTAALERIEEQLDTLSERIGTRGSKGARKPSGSAKKGTKNVSQDAAVDRRLKKLEQKLTDATEQLERAEAVASSAKSRGPKPVKLPKGKLDVNELTFEEFRALGLSVTQSSRLVALRDMNDGFSEIDEIDRVVGFPKELRQDLKRRLIVRD